MSSKIHLSNRNVWYWIEHFFLIQCISRPPLVASVFFSLQIYFINHSKKKLSFGSFIYFQYEPFSLRAMKCPNEAIKSHKQAFFRVFEMNAARISIKVLFLLLTIKTKSYRGIAASLPPKEVYARALHLVFRSTAFKLNDRKKKKINNRKNENDK